MAQAEWNDIQITEQYSVSFSLIQGRILLTTPKGLSNGYAVREVWRLRNDFLTKHLGPDERFIEIKDYAKIASIPPIDSRRAQTELFLKDIGHSLGYIAIGMSPVLRTISQFGLLLHRPVYPFEFHSDLDSAFERAMQIDLQHSGEKRLDNRGILWMDQWKHEGKGCKVEIGLQPPHVMILRAEGVVTQQDLIAIHDLHRKVYLSGLLNTHHYYKYTDYTGLNKYDVGLRFRFAGDIRKLHKEFGLPRLDMVSPLSRLQDMALWSVSRILSETVLKVESLNEALEIARRDLERHPDIATPSTFSRNPSISLTSHDLDALVQEIATLSWFVEDRPIKRVPRSHPLHSVYDALELARVDFRALQSDNQRSVEKLEQAKTSVEYALRTRSEFLTTISHEIRTPLNGIYGMFQLLRDSSPSTESKEYIEIGSMSALSLINLMNNLLDLGKLESGRFQAEAQSFTLRPLLASIEKLYIAQSREKGIGFVMKVDEMVPDDLHSDPLRLRQILQNLLENALKFTPVGQVTLSISMQHPDLDTILFQVHDTGIGIREEDQVKLFQAFSQADGTISRKYGGTGLGLAISKQMVQLLGGEIGLRSKRGEGSTFWFTLPLPATFPTNP